MNKRHLLFFGLILIGGLTSCKKEDVGPSDQSIFDSNKEDIQSYATSKGLSGTFTTSGVYYALTKPGSSTVAPAEGLEAEYSYSLYTLISASTSAAAVTARFVDSTYATKSAYLAMAPSQIQNLSPTAAGLTLGLLQMHVGEQGVIMVPSYYGLGRGGSDNGLIPPNAPLLLNATLKQVRTEDEQINQYLTGNMLTPSEVTINGTRFIKTVSNPTGATPTAGRAVTVRYRGTLLRSKTAFDSTAGTTTRDFTFGGSVAGFDQGIARLRVGEKATVVFPSKAGYGAAGTGPIPPYAPLRFDIELVGAQ